MQPRSGPRRHRTRDERREKADRNRASQRRDIDDESAISMPAQLVKERQEPDDDQNTDEHAAKRPDEPDNEPFRQHRARELSARSSDRGKQSKLALPPSDAYCERGRG